jgi:uncharacterized protein YndB with AHSA1/START domain
MQFNIVINSPIDTVFSLITDLKNYDKWLPASDIYSEVTQISDADLKLGTTYIDKGTSTVMQGEITEFYPPCHVTFSQTTQFKLLMFNTRMDIQIKYTLQTVENGTKVTRDFTLYVLGILKLMQPVLMNTIRKENERILQVMKTYLEAQV